MWWTSPNDPSPKSANPPSISCRCFSLSTNPRCLASRRRRPFSLSPWLKLLPNLTSLSAKPSTPITAPKKKTPKSSKKTTAPKTSNSSLPTPPNFPKLWPNQPVRPPSTAKWTKTNSNCCRRWESRSAAADTAAASSQSTVSNWAANWAVAVSVTCIWLSRRQVGVYSPWKWWANQK